jgi:hypothetical protein
MLAHIAGVPVEEWITPVVTTGGAVVLALRTALQRFHRRSERP